MEENLRFYTFINCYLSSIQQGIQTAHLVHALLTKYQTATTAAGSMAYFMAWSWAKDHKTIIVLNGGDSDSIWDAKSILESQREYPWTMFKESDASLEGILTGVGIVLPESVFAQAQIAPTGITTCSATDSSLIELIRSKGLAR